MLTDGGSFTAQTMGPAGYVITYRAFGCTVKGLARPSCQDAALEIPQLIDACPGGGKRQHVDYLLQYCGEFEIESLESKGSTDY